MIYILLEEQEFRNDIFDEVKLFFPDEEISFIDNLPSDVLAGIFLLCKRSLNENGKDSYMLSISKPDFYKSINIPIDNEDKCEISDERRRELRREIKRQIYLMLEECTDKRLPWGMLTGIRPVKIVSELIEKDYAKEEILDTLTDYYRLSQEKANLAFDVAVVENEIIRKTDRNTVSVYIGIPFCPSRCLYCSFTSNPIDKYSYLVNGYLTALKMEINGVQDIIKEKGYRIQSLYIGGGTPTSIDADSLKDLLEHINKSFDLNSLEEFTLEAGRPDSINREKLEAAKANGVDRISINPQTMNDRTLGIIGRSHTVSDIIEAFDLARRVGFTNINMDVIVGLPGEDAAMFENTLKEIERLAPECLTVHTMSIKRASRLNENKDKFSFIKGTEAEDMVNMARDYAYTMGMHPYYLYRQKNILGNLENIGYCKPGFESIYNIQIMEEKQSIFALGAGGITKIVYPEDNRIERAFNVKNVEEYIGRLEEMLERKKILL